MYLGSLIATLFHFLYFGKSRLVWNIRQSLYSLNNESWKSITSLCGLSLLSGIPQFIIFNSHEGKSHHKKYFLFSKNFIVIPNGVKLDDLTTTNKKFVINKNRLLYVARFHTIKNFTTFFRVVKEVLYWNSDISVDIFGDGWLENAEIVNTYFNNDLFFLSRITIHGNVMSLNRIYSNGGVLVQTSVSEGLSNVILEAMYYGCFIVASNVGDTKEVLIEKRFIVNDCFDSNAYFNSIKQLFSMPSSDLAVLLEKQHSQITKFYSQRSMIDSFNKFI